MEKSLLLPYSIFTMGSMNILFSKTEKAKISTWKKPDKSGRGERAPHLSMPYIQKLTNQYVPAPISQKVCTSFRMLQILPKKAFLPM